MSSRGFGRVTLPYGVFSTVQDSRRRLGVAVDDAVIDLVSLARAYPGLPHEVAAALEAPTLNAFMALGRTAWSDARGWLQQSLSQGRPAQEDVPVLALDEVVVHLPFEVADYVDFYSSQHHAENVGRLFRPDGEPLTPNWKHLPIGYHGRAGTVVVSGTDVRRPIGQRLIDGVPEVGPSGRLDIECEVGFVVGKGSALGRPVAVDDAGEHVFGVVLLNDWSARDLQAFEYVPLGPFLGKSFATSISAWVVPMEALQSARVPQPAQDPVPADYLRGTQPWGLDLALEVEWNGTAVSRPPFASMYWTFAQQLAHLTSNGANLRTGDLFASGTVSGGDPSERGSFLELSWAGSEPVELDDGSTRTFLEDGDTVVLRGQAPGADGEPVHLGEVRGTVLPAAVT